MLPKILIIGAGGQIGTELTIALRQRYGTPQVIATDINSTVEATQLEPFEILDALNYDAIKDCVKKHEITTVYLLAALLSATAEKYPEKAWKLNTESLFHILNLAKDGLIKQIFWPSSIAVFGPSTPKVNTPQSTITDPSTVYGITKLAGERWCSYYKKTYGVDVRSLRYPGIISWKTKPGGGTTDYAVDIFYKAITEGHYNCYLNENTILPMMYMDDAISATLNLMSAQAGTLTLASAYNLAAVSFSPKDLANTIKKYLPQFTISYKSDFRQNIADSWPQSIDDSCARKDWNWHPQFDLDDITKTMLTNLKLTL